ncbi:hypothetical protein D9M71_616280 [compost metagenome]
MPDHVHLVSGSEQQQLAGCRALPVRTAAHPALQGQDAMPAGQRQRADSDLQPPVGAEQLQLRHGLHVEMDIGLTAPAGLQAALLDLAAEQCCHLIQIAG